MQQPPNPEYSQPPYQQPTQQPYNVQQTPVPPPPYQYGNYPPQQPIKPRKSKTWIWIVGLILAFLIGRASVTTANHSDTAAPQTTTTTNQQVAAQPTQAPTQPPKPQVWTTVQTFQGNGSKKTGTFSVPDDWKIKWTCNPASFGGADYNVIVGVYNSDGSIADFGAINSTCKNGSVAGETEEHQGGNVYLDITSEGDWTFTVQELN